MANLVEVDDIRGRAAQILSVAYGPSPTYRSPEPEHRLDKLMIEIAKEDVYPGDFSYYYYHDDHHSKIHFLFSDENSAFAFRLRIS